MRKGQKITEEHRRAISCANSGEKHPLWGRKHSEETRRKMREAAKGRPPVSREARRKMSEKKCGEKHPRWKGGKDRQFQYGPEWREIAKQIRRRDGYKCMIVPDHPFAGNNVPSVHHIEPAYDLMDNGIYPHDGDNLISLCPSCHHWADAHLDESVPLLKSLLHEHYAFTTSHENIQPM